VWAVARPAQVRASLAVEPRTCRGTDQNATVRGHSSSWNRCKTKHSQVCWQRRQLVAYPQSAQHSQLVFLSITPCPVGDLDILMIWWLLRENFDGSGSQHCRFFVRPRLGVDAGWTTWQLPPKYTRARGLSVGSIDSGKSGGIVSRVAGRSMTMTASVRTHADDG